MSDNTLNKVMRGLEEAKGYLEGKRKHYNVTMPCVDVHNTQELEDDLKSKVLGQRPLLHEQQD